MAPDLSHFGLMQLPRRLGRQLRSKAFNRRTGKVDRVLLTVKNDAWLAKNAWYIPLRFFRLAAHDADEFKRPVIGDFPSFLLLCAIVTGLLSGGKTCATIFVPSRQFKKFTLSLEACLESKAY